MDDHAPGAPQLHHFRSAATAIEGRRMSAPAPPRQERRRSAGKSLREALSLTIWVVMAAGTAAGRFAYRAVAGFPRILRSRRRAAGAVDVDRPPTAQRRRWPQRLRLGAGATLAAVALAALCSGPALRLAARPLAAVAANGLPAIDQRSTLLAVDGSTLGVLHDGINRQLVPLDEVPQVLRQAVLAAEDKGFWDHGGYDGEAMARALLANVRAGEVTQGGSTISQQLAKQNFSGGEQSVLRKAKELLYAVAIEERLSKEQLFERYLNQVYFGSQAYGVVAAAEEFFGASLKQLTVEQAALLAGLIRAPAALDPRTDPDSATIRRNQVLRSMASLGAISRETAADAAAKPVEVLPARPADGTHRFIVEAAKREFLANPAFGTTEAERRHLLLTGGLEIRTTINPNLQQAARTALGSVSDRLGSSLVAVDPRTGAVRALHNAGTAASNQFDVAMQGRRPPGSTFKPLAAAAALEAGMPQTQYLVGDGPIELDYRGAPQPWRVNNFEGEQHGPVALADAVIYSVNTAFAQIGVAVGPGKIADVARRLGIDVERAMGPAEARGPAVALGGLSNGVSPVELASAYGAFAAGGAHTAPYLIERVVDRSGRELYKATPALRPVLDEAVNGILVDILQDAVAEGTGSAASLPGWEPLGKTGTSEKGADAWFVGATPVLSAAVWVGHPEGTEPVRGLTGGSVAAPAWGRFMTTALRGFPPVTFAPRSADRPATRPLDLPVARACTSCPKPANQ
jgi:penicillin-binding protein 1A